MKANLLQTGGIQAAEAEAGTEMATSVVFEEWVEALESRCLEVAANPTDGQPPSFDLCIACHKKADFETERLSACLCHDDIMYSICRECDGTAESEQVIEAAMKEANVQRTGGRF